MRGGRRVRGCWFELRGCKAWRRRGGRSDIGAQSAVGSGDATRSPRRVGVAGNSTAREAHGRSSSPAVPPTYPALALVEAVEVHRVLPVHSLDDGLGYDSTTGAWRRVVRGAEAKQSGHRSHCCADRPKPVSSPLQREERSEPLDMIGRTYAWECYAGQQLARLLEGDAMDPIELFKLLVTPALTAAVVGLLLARRQELLKFELARQLEAMKHEFSRISVLYQRRADGLAKVWPAIRRAEDLLRNAVSPWQRAGDDEAAKLNAALHAHQDLVSLWDANAVFLPELEEPMDRYTALILDVVHEYTMSRTEGMPPDMRHQHWLATKKKMEEVSVLRKAIRSRGMPLLASTPSVGAGLTTASRLTPGSVAQLPAPSGDDGSKARD